MPALAGRTRRQLRAAVLYNIGAIFEGTASATGTTGTIVDNKLALGSTDDHKGKYIWFTSGTNNANLIRVVTASAVSSNVTTLTFLPVITDATAAADTYQLIGPKANPIHPDIVNGFINQAIIEVTGLAFDPEESVALHGDGRQRRFDVPSEFKMISDIFTRQSVESAVIHDAASAWDEASAPSNVTRAVDTQDYRGSGANKFTIAGGFTTGLVSSKAITSLDLSAYDYVEFWVKSSTTTVSGDFTLLLDNTAACVSALETLTIPALTANTWTFVRVALSTPSLDTAIISVGLNAANNIAANTIWISDVRVVRDDSAVWVRMDRANWRTDEEARDVIFTFAPLDRLIKLVGGDNPLIFTADTDTCEIDDQYVIARATELTLLSKGFSGDPDAMRALAGFWHSAAEKAKGTLMMPVGARAVS